LHTSIARTVALLATLVTATALPGCAKKDDGVASAQTKPVDQPKAAEPGKAGAAAPADKAPAAAAAPAKPMGLPVKAETVKILTMQSDVSAVGTLIAADSVVIRPEIAGRVVGLHFQEGQLVQKGGKLVTLDSSEYSAQLAGSTAAAKTESQRYQRAQELLDKNFISKEALDVAKGNMDRALAKQRQDDALLSKSTITAPFSGVVGLRQISPGAYVKAGDDIVRLENLSSVKLDFRVPEMYLSQIKPGQELTIKVDAYPNDVFRGRIYALEPAVDEKTRTVVVRAQIPNLQNKLRPGMFARVNVLLSTRPNALVIPEQAIWPQGNDTFVYRVVDGKAALTKIELGVRRPGEVEVLKGLTANDVIVTDGQMKLKDGAPVMVLPAQPAPPKAAFNQSGVPRLVG
jgi:membrane fusion protein, multidrug efflux system